MCELNKALFFSERQPQLIVFFVCVIADRLLRKSWS